MKASGLGENVDRRWWPSGQPHSGSRAETITVGHGHTVHTHALVSSLKTTRPSESERVVEPEAGDEISGGVGRAKNRENERQAARDLAEESEPELTSPLCLLSGTLVTNRAFF